MDYFKACCQNDLQELQRTSQTAYVEAFHNLIKCEDVKIYVNCKYSPENIKREFDDKSNHFLLYFFEDKLAGYMKYILKHNTLEIDRLYILKNFKSLGIGSKCIRKAEALAKRSQKKALTLGVLELNNPAITFYEKRGFTQYSQGAVMVGNNEYPLLFMKKDL